MVKTSDFESENSGSTPDGPAKPQTDREIAEMIAKFRTHPGGNWTALADDIETLLKSRPKLEDMGYSEISERADTLGYSLCDGYCHEFCSSDY